MVHFASNRDGQLKREGQSAQRTCRVFSCKLHKVSQKSQETGTVAQITWGHFTFKRYWLNSDIYNNKQTIKTGSRLQKLSADKYM